VRVGIGLELRFVVVSLQLRGVRAEGDGDGEGGCCLRQLQVHLRGAVAARAHRAGVLRLGLVTLRCEADHDEDGKENQGNDVEDQTEGDKALGRDSATALLDPAQGRKQRDEQEYPHQNPRDRSAIVQVVHAPIDRVEVVGGDRRRGVRPRGQAAGVDGINQRRVVIQNAVNVGLQGPHLGHRVDAGADEEGSVDDHDDAPHFHILRGGGAATHPDGARGFRLGRVFTEGKWNFTENLNLIFKDLSDASISNTLSCGLIGFVNFLLISKIFGVHCGGGFGLEFFIDEPRLCGIVINGAGEYWIKCHFQISFMEFEFHIIKVHVKETEKHAFGDLEWHIFQIAVHLFNDCWLHFCQEGMNFMDIQTFILSWLRGW